MKFFTHWFKFNVLASARFFNSRLLWVFSILCGCSQSHVGSAPVKPVLSIQGITQVRSTTDGNMRFYISLDKATTTDVTVDYAMADGTATSPKDYTNSSGTVTIPAKQNQAYIDVPFKGDPTNLRQPNLQFTVTLSNPKSCTIGTSVGTGVLVTENGTYLPTDNTGYSTPNTYAGYTLAWSDEFSGASLDLTAWNQEQGNNNGWGNSELEYYTSSTKNSFVSNGNLIIEARKESISGFNYSSARLTTQNKKTFTYGRIDIRAKLPVVKGIWPALWMLGSNITTVNWPKCGEIDIMELVGQSPSTVYGTMHWADANGNAQQNNGNHQYVLSSGDFSNQFHVYSIAWKQDTIRSYVDDVLYLTTTKTDVGSTYPFNADEFFIFNVAVGGNWPGPPDTNVPFLPQRMFVDYVRVFQKQ